MLQEPIYYLAEFRIWLLDKNFDSQEFSQNGKVHKNIFLH